MIRNVPKLTRLLSSLLGCIVVLYSSRVGHAASPNVAQLLTKAQQGFVNQEIELAEAYLTGKGVPPDPALAAHWYEKAAESGNAEAQNLVGHFYASGIGVSADPARALRWYQLARASGSSSATLNIGVLYALGLGVTKDVDLAAKYFHDAFDKGNGRAAGFLGVMNYFGIGAEQDLAAAERWFDAGEKLHDPVSTYNLGTLYSVSPDHPHDPVRAARLLRQSADAGYVPAIHALGLLLIHHPELAKFPGESQGLVESAADAGYWRSSMLLGIMSRDGVNVPKDDKGAFYHFQLAVLQGGADVQRLLTNDIDKLNERLGTGQTQALESEAKIWFQQHHFALNFVHVKGHKFLPIPGNPDPSDVLRAGMPFPNHGL
ncbi:MAG: sel1 repeat family protein [Acidobacteriota bacterium]|nr:sel1 repeat family protein [Acidobacteriota bacterium]